MAYIQKEKVAEIRKAIRAAFPSYKVSVTSDMSAVTVTLMAGNFDVTACIADDRMGNKKLGEGYMQLNPYYPTFYTGKLKEFHEKVNSIMDSIEKQVNYNANDPLADYCDYNHYRYIHVGKWDKPFVNTTNG